MNRTIRLSRIHALNWYGYQDSIQVEGNILLAGVTGSGKSILMDLVQLVLVGDQRLVRFNQSATGDRSGRTLKGYCLGDTKEEQDGVTQFMRQSAITYAALEFTWPGGRRSETWGLRIEFGSAAETHGKVTPFFVPCALERSDFLDSSRRPLEYPIFKALVEHREGRLYTEGLDAYLRDMAQPVHLNFERGILRSLLPSAMSFTFLRSFNEFCRDYILPAERVDITDVRASYRTFLAYERDLTELNDQFARLQAVRNTFTQWSGHHRDSAVARYLEAELRHEHAVELQQEEQARLQALERDFEVEARRLEVLASEIPALKQRVEQNRAAIGEREGGPLYLHLKSNIPKLNARVARLREIGRSLEQALDARLRTAQAWVRELRQCPVDLDPSVPGAVERAIREVEVGGLERAAATLPALAEAAEKAAAEVSRAANASRGRLAEVRGRLGQLREELAALALGRLPIPTRVLDALNEALPPRDGEPAARHLCQLCEVIDESWRPAIEVAFTRKFAIVVEREDYDQAERIYHELKAERLGDAGRESLIRPDKALRLSRSPKPGSLATKLSTSHPVAEAIVNHLFGDLACVERREDLRRHEFAIMPDGFMTRGAFVERPRFFDGIPFVGRRGLEQQRAFKDEERLRLEVQERQLVPVETFVRSISESRRERFGIDGDLYQDLARAKDLPALEAELADNFEKLQRIDRTQFEAIEMETTELEALLDRDLREERDLLQSQKRSELETLRGKVSAMRHAAERFETRFKAVREQRDISPWLTRLAELRAAALAEYPLKDAAADYLKDLSQDHEVREAATWEQVKALRRELAQAHSRFSDLPIECADNEAHDRQLARLAESDIPDYTEKAKRERRSWEGLFRTSVLDKLHQALREVVDLVLLLNNSLQKRPIGTHRYQLHYRRNPDVAIYHELLSASALAHSDELFFASAEPRFRDALQRLLTLLTEQPDSPEATRLLDYRHYYDYDLEVVEEDGRKTSVDRHSDKFSGGENQSPYFIAILASYLRAYRRYDTRRRVEPSIGLVPIDEAFSKLSGERIKDCITALKAFDLQGLFSMSTGNIPYAFEHCDWLIVVSKEQRRSGQRTEIRNLALSLARESDEAEQLMGR